MVCQVGGQNQFKHFLSNNWPDLDNMVNNIQSSRNRLPKCNPIVVELQVYSIKWEEQEN